MSFEVSAQAYGRFMGRYSEPLAVRFLDMLGLDAGQRALDVGCGAGALTAALVSHLGGANVTAVDPSESFISEMVRSFPDLDIQQAAAERLPFGDEGFDRTLAQLVVHFMTDPVAGLREMARVTKPDGLVAANVWDHAGEHGPLAAFWRAARELDAQVPDESQLPGVAEGQLAEFFDAAGMKGADATKVSVFVTHPSFDDWWEPYLLGVGPAGAHVASLDPDRKDQLREECRRQLPPAPFTIEASAWTSIWRK